MQVDLTPQGEELLRKQLALRDGQSPGQVLESALRHLAREESELTQQEKERRRKAIEGVREFRRKHRLTLNAGGQRLRDLIHEGHKFE